MKIIYIFLLPVMMSACVLPPGKEYRGAQDDPVKRAGEDQEIQKWRQHETDTLTPAPANKVKLQQDIAGQLDKKKAAETEIIKMQHELDKLNGIEPAERNLDFDQGVDPGVMMMGNPVFTQPPMR